jgi:hypothetical protein
LGRLPDEKDKYTAALLGNALASLAAERQGDLATKVFQQILGRLQNEKDVLAAAELGVGLASLAEGVQGDLAAKGAKEILDRLTDEKESLRVALLSDDLVRLAGREQMPVLIELFKWPVLYFNRNLIIQRIDELEGAPPYRFGSLDDEGNYHAHLWQFVDWARNQKLDVDSPPVGPQHLAERFGNLFPK